MKIKFGATCKNPMRSETTRARGFKTLVLTGDGRCRDNGPLIQSDFYKKLSNYYIFNRLAVTARGQTVIFTTLFCGFGEEIFFRGYIQGLLNKALKRKWNIKGIRFGWGLIMASLIFGFGHGLANFNPFDVKPFSFHFLWAESAVTAVEGFILGLLYEYTGGIVAPAALHAFIGLFFGAVIFPT